MDTVAGAVTAPEIAVVEIDETVDWTAAAAVGAALMACVWTLNGADVQPAGVMLTDQVPPEVVAVPIQAFTPVRRPEAP